MKTLLYSLLAMTIGFSPFSRADESQGKVKTSFDLYGLTMLASLNSEMTLKEVLPLFYNAQDTKDITAFLEKRGVNVSIVKMNSAKVSDKTIQYNGRTAKLTDDFKVVTYGEVLKYDKTQSPAQNFMHFYAVLEGKSQSASAVGRILLPAASANLGDAVLGGAIVAGAIYAPQIAQGAVIAAGTVATGAGIAAGTAATGVGIAVGAVVSGVASVASATVGAALWVGAGIAGIGVGGLLASAAVGYGAYEAWERHAWDGALTCSKSGNGHYDFNFVTKDSWWAHANFAALTNMEPWKLQYLLYGTCSPELLKILNMKEKWAEKNKQNPEAPASEEVLTGSAAVTMQACPSTKQTLSNNSLKSCSVANAAAYSADISKSRGSYDKMRDSATGAGVTN